MRFQRFVELQTRLVHDFMEQFGLTTIGWDQPEPPAAYGVLIRNGKLLQLLDERVP